MICFSIFAYYPTCLLDFELLRKLSTMTVVRVIPGGFVRARSWRTALTFRSSPTASCTLWSLRTHLRKIRDATHALHPISTVLTPRQLRSMWKVMVLSFWPTFYQLSQTLLVIECVCLFVQTDRCLLFWFWGRTALWTCSPVSFSRAVS